MYHGKNDQKRKIHALKGSLTLTNCKILLIEYKSQIQTIKFINQPQKTTKSQSSTTRITDRPQKTTKSWTSTTKFTGQTSTTGITYRLQMTTNIGHRLQSLLVIYDRHFVVYVQQL